MGVKEIHEHNKMEGKYIKCDTMLCARVIYKSDGYTLQNFNQMFFYTFINTASIV